MDPLESAKTIAQHRRQLENQEFCHLGSELPLARAISGQHIDKTTMVRLAVAYIQLHMNLPLPNPSPCELDKFWGNHPLELMDSFFMILSSIDDILYVSETISIYLGLSQVEMMGHNMVDYIHSEDWRRFQNVLDASSASTQTINVRIKSSLTKRATKDSSRASPGFKVIRLELTVKGEKKLLHCVPLPSMVLSTISIQNNSFVLTLSLDLKIYSADEKAEQMLGDPYTANSLRNLSFYQLIHIEDVEIIKKMHCEIFSLGAYKTPYYRMLLQRGQGLTFFVESNVYRYASMSFKRIAVETLTIVSIVV